jgi:F420-non-reducing hydrogenase iron-sulfur subunit
MRLNYPTNVKIIRVPCTGKVDTIHMLRAFEKGADGVCVVGCMEGDCHYNSGNFRARKRVAQVSHPGADRDRRRAGPDVQPVFGRRPRFAQYAVEMTERITAFGSQPHQAGPQACRRLKGRRMQACGCETAR